MDLQQQPPMKKANKRKKYDVYQTPYEALKKIKAVGFLKPGVSFVQLEATAKQYSDNEYAALMEKEKQKLFDKIQLKPIDF